jgi:hypothetical protein
MSTASPELLKRLTDRQMNDEKKKRWLSAEVREKGYQLAVRELYGENSVDYWEKKRVHDQSLYKLYKLERKA